MPTISCAVCGVKVEGARARQKYCSAKCKERGKPSAKWQGGVHGVVPHGTQSGYQYHKCRCAACTEAQREIVASYAAKVKAGRGISPSALYKRRSSGHPDDSLLCVECGLPVGRSRFSAKSEPRHTECQGKYSIPRATRLAVYERDGLVCHLCGAECDPTAGVYDDQYPTLDHLIPRSRGGGHGPENLATAHRICNIKRGDRPLKEVANVSPR